MKLLLQSIFLIMATHASGVMGTLAVRIVFNRGANDPSKFCSPTDWDMVEGAADKGAARRRLGQTSSRQLQGAYCHSVCSYFPPGLCYLSGTGCRYRRALESETTDQDAPVEQVTESSPAGRQLFTVAACDIKKTRVLEELAAIATKVGPSCQALISSKVPELMCFDV
jgi:hypothetical protein